jgi:hypothetical protein
MTDAAPKPNTTPPAAGGPGEEPQGSLGAVLIGGAILLIAGLLIFWPGGDSATGRMTGPDGKVGGVQGSDIAGGPGSGRASGIKPREVDPAEGRVRPSAAFAAPGQGLAMMPTPKPEPTSFPSAAAEIAYFEKKLEQARRDVVARTTFLERMKRIQDRAPLADHERNIRRAKVVQENYDKAVKRVEELEAKIAGLRAKQTGG